MSTYRLDRSFDWNFRNGPAYDGGFPHVPETPMKDYFGIPTNSRVGVAASVLVNQRWVETYARLGFDLLTYKTVRIRERRCHNFPNWVFLDDGPKLDGGNGETALVRRARRPGDLLALTGAGSFGMPSRRPAFWQDDIRRTRAMMETGQVLIVSIVATPEPGMTAEALAGEFERLAAMVSEAGAQVVEANLSCPNVRTGEGELYRDPAMVARVATATRAGAGSRPVTLKLGYIADDHDLAPVLHAAEGFTDGIVLMNGINRAVVDRDGTPTFGPGRETCGITGKGLRDLAVDSVARAVSIVARERLNLKIIGTGGIMRPEDAGAFFEAGAYAVFSASGAIFDPHLAVHIKSAHPEW